MDRDSCWMSFSEALEQYLSARDDLKHYESRHRRTDAQERMKEAAEHMDALTALEKKE